MRSSDQLAALARRLNHAAGAPAIPALYFFTDPARIADPVAVATQLPRGAAVVYRHFGAADRLPVARGLARICRLRGLKLLIAGDPALAARVSADGVHWPERLLPERRDLGHGLVTAAAHGPEALARAARFGADAAILAPVFPTRSGSGREAIGVFRACQWARAAQLPVIALGGVTPEHARRLAGRGFSGLAAVDALA